MYATKGNTHNFHDPVRKHYKMLSAADVYWACNILIFDALKTKILQHIYAQFLKGSL